MNNDKSHATLSGHINLIYSNMTLRYLVSCLNLAKSSFANLWNGAQVLKFWLDFVPQIALYIAY